jgi:ABC-type Mn2+/Zn2+ transport system permease subunit
MLSDWLELGFLRRALVAGTLVAFSCGLLSPYVVLRRMAFAGHGLAHVAFGGAAIALLIGANLSLGGGLFAGMVAVLLAVWTRKGRITEDSAIGILVPASMALGVICLSLRKGYTQDVFSFLFGNILAVLPGDLLFSAIVTSLTLLCVLAFARPLMAATFHEELARVEGYRVQALRVLLFLLVAVNVVAAMKLVGAILVAALLVVPGALALLFVKRFGLVQATAAIVGVAGVVLGLFISYLVDLPSGAVIALLLFLSYGASRLLAALLERSRGQASTLASRDVV